MLEVVGAKSMLVEGRLQVQIDLKGDLPGHPFRGNQWTGGSGSGGESGRSFSGRGYSSTSSLDDINSVKMLHTTKTESLDSIRENGFRVGSNSMYGEGVYFSDRKVYGNDQGMTSVQVKLKSHTQVYVDKDFDVPRVIEEITGKSMYSGNSRESLIAAGVGSLRFKVDDETYTLVLDPKLIEIE